VQAKLLAVPLRTAGAGQRLEAGAVVAAHKVEAALTEKKAGGNTEGHGT
jgi:hypothetical protein